VAEEESLLDRITELIIGQPKYTSDEVAQATGMSSDDAQRLWVELGFPATDPEDRHFTDADVEVLKVVRELQLNGAVDDDLVISMTRVLGQALSRIAYAQAENLQTRMVPGQGLDGTTRLEIDEEQLSMLAPVLLDGNFERFLSYAWRRHLAEAIRHELQGHENDDVVGFADLVGYSSLANRMEPADLPDLISDFERLAYHHVSQAGGRVVKFIGDAVMFTVPNPTSAADAGLGLRTSRHGDRTLPQVRVGMAMGPVVSIEGDLFGDTVNRANRLTEVAHPGTVLLDDDLGRALDDKEDVVVRPLRPRKLKGVGYTRAWVLRRVDTSEG
jgi:adenylate cyclase